MRRSATRLRLTCARCAAYGNKNDFGNRFDAVTFMGPSSTVLSDDDANHIGLDLDRSVDGARR
jgi:hypothetical protein